MKITRIVTDPTQIWRILTKIDWPTTAPDFDEPQDLVEWDICQLVPGSVDGFPEEYDSPHVSSPDPLIAISKTLSIPALGRFFHTIRLRANHHITVRGSLLPLFSQTQNQINSIKQK